MGIEAGVGEFPAKFPFTPFLFVVEGAFDDNVKFKEVGDIVIDVDGEEVDGISDGSWDGLVLG